MKLPVTFSLGNRQASLEKDALMRNALAEADGEKLRARKRPAIDSAYTANVATGQGQGLFTWFQPGPLDPTETLISIVGNSLNTEPAPINKALIFLVQPT